MLGLAAVSVSEFEITSKRVIEKTEIHTLTPNSTKEQLAPLHTQTHTLLWDQ